MKNGDFENILSDGLRKKIIKQSISETIPKVGNRVGIFYVGTFVNGTEFDSNRIFGSDYSRPFSFVIGDGTVIAGMNTAVLHMKVGETAFFEIGSQYAYGDDGCPGTKGSPAIPPGATICFEIELVSCQTPELTFADRRQMEDRANLAEARAVREAAAQERALKLTEKGTLKSVPDSTLVPSEPCAPSDSLVPVVKDARWAKLLNPKDLKSELKARNLSIQGSKKELLTRLLSSL